MIRRNNVEPSAHRHAFQYTLFDGNLLPTLNFNDCTRGPSGHFSNRFNFSGQRIYVASRTIHAPKWLKLRAQGVPVVSSWIDEFEQGASKDLESLAVRCIDEVLESSHFILYSEPGDYLKGALLECGAALARDIPVYAVGSGPSFSRVFGHHPRWHSLHSIEAALRAISLPDENSHPGFLRGKPF